MTAGGAIARVPPPALFVGSGLTQYAGAAIAVGLFAAMGAAEVAWLRIAVSAAVFVAWRRPWRAPWTRRHLGWAGVYGVTLAAMNICFYLAIGHLPLGNAVAIEFIGPVAVAAITGRGWRDRAAIAVAAAGVVLLAGVTLGSDLPRADAVAGLVAIAGAATFWAAYIVLGRRVNQAMSGTSALAVGMSAGALVFAPFLAPAAIGGVASAQVAAKVLAIAVCSSVIPYAIEQVILRRVTAARFSILTALLPATAMVVGALALRQWPLWTELSGLALVSAAIAMTARPR